MPKRLIATALILIVIGALPRIFALIHLPLPPAAGVLELLSVPPHVRQWLVDYISFYSIGFVGVVLLLLAGVLVARHFLGKHLKDQPISTSSVLLQEVKAIHDKDPDPRLLQEIDSFYGRPERQQAEEQLGGARQGRVPDEIRHVSPGLFRWLNGIEPRGRTALCLSGGGIRSASFALGVLQALAIHPRMGSASSEGVASGPEKSLLSQFNYLSTVSGGGYIGSWFSSWVRRVGYASVWRDLARIAGRAQDPGEQAAPVKWLRVHSNFLTPQLGLSGDTLAGVAIVLRNLLLNWLVLLPALCAVLIVMKLMALEVFRLWDNDWTTRAWVPLLVWLVLLVSALSFTLRNRPSQSHNRENQADETAYLLRGLLPSTLAAVAFTLLMALSILHLDAYLLQLKEKYPLLAGSIEPASSALRKPSQYGFIIGAFIGALIYALSYAVSWIRSWPEAVVRTWGRTQSLFRRDGRFETGLAGSSNFWRWTLSGAIYGTLLTAITYFFLNSSEAIEKLIFLDYLRDYWVKPSAAGLAESADMAKTAPRRLLALIYLGVPLMLVAQLIAEMIFVGLTSDELNADEDREWLGRGAGLLLLAGLAWFVGMHLAYVSTDITIRAGAFFSEHPLESLAIFAVLYVIGAVAAAVGRSGRTPAQQGPQMGAKAKTANVTLSVVAAVLVVVVVVGISAMIDFIVLGHTIAARVTREILHDGRVNFIVAFLVVLFIGLIASTNINVNRFSLHAFYRNRLIRMFLGASNLGRRPNPFTDFDQDDNIPMYKMWRTANGDAVGVGGPPAGEAGWQPFHVVNIALNVTSSNEHLEWQERKAASFTVSPLHSGSAVTGFRASEKYGGGISLGTAIAISGAAVSPNMGYNSSPVVALLMALFNVRLGWWLGNPGPKGKVTHTYDGPRNALIPFMAEMLGMTRDTNKYVYLSDGGHFENLALYEMVRRRCRFIVLSDAGCDPDFTFEDLGNAVRKIEIDLGVSIHFSGLDKLKPRHSVDSLEELLGRRAAPPDNLEASPYHAIGIIDYRTADGPGVEDGIILYIKPGYHGTESSAGIRGYAIANPSFPHDATSNQWFGESQMESYRALGFEIMDGLLRQAQDLKGKPDLSLREVLEALKEHGAGKGRAASAAPSA